MELRISDVARLVNRHPGTLREYERRGILPAARRDPVAGWRTYTLEEVGAIQRIIFGSPEGTAKALARKAQ